VSIKKALEQIYEDKLFAWCLDIINLTMIASLFVIYMYRTTNMCLFDSDPIWKFFESEEEGGGYIDGECPQHELGIAQGWYTIFLIASHTIFLLDFLFRVFISKYCLKFLGTMDSAIEIFTTVPLLLIWGVAGEQNT
jgi:hypothetical protein